VQGLAGLVGGLGALIVGMAPAYAVQPVSIKIAAGVGGDYLENHMGELENESPANEQAVATTIEKNGETYLILAYMSGNVPEELAPNQVKCSSFKLTATGPVLMADQEYLTENKNTDRPGNKPALESLGDRAIFGFGYAPNNVNTATYVQTVDEMCRLTSDRVKVSNNNNQNIGAPYFTTIGPDRIFVTYYSNNGNETRGRILNVSGTTIEKGDNINLLNPANIGRGPTVTMGGNPLICTGLGENRPPEYGIGCTLVNGQTGEIIWKNQIVKEANPEAKMYYNQTSLAKIDETHAALLFQLSNGDGKNGDDKGDNASILQVLEISQSGPVVRSEIGDRIDRITIHGTHSALIAGGIGETGERVFGIFESAPAMNGLGAVSFLRFDSTTTAWKPLDKAMDRWVTSAYNTDGGLLSNIYGNNPGDQGRNYLHGIGDVKNPGYGVEGGFMKDAETLFILPYTGLPDDTKAEPKLAAYVTFLPGKVSVAAPPSSPKPYTKDDYNPNGATPGNSGRVGENGEMLAPLVQPKSGGCSVSPEGQSGSAGGLAVLGLALLGLAASRRRKES
jgi:MYXO-CTERM domain-containing protein